MMRSRHVLRGVSWLLLSIVGAVVCLAIGHAVRASIKLPHGPIDLIWDKAACVACGMHVGEPGFAAQITTKDGRTVAFDDPGCCFAYIEEQNPDIHAVWFHHSTDQRWLPRSGVSFVHVETSPMGFGLAAVDPRTPDSIDCDTARRICLERSAVHP